MPDSLRSSRTRTTARMQAFASLTHMLRMAKNRRAVALPRFAFLFALLFFCVSVLSYPQLLLLKAFRILKLVEAVGPVDSVDNFLTGSARLVYKIRPCG